MNKDIHAYYQALGLKEGAGPAEIRRAYRQMVQTWHPDLFKPGSVMQMTAEDITKEVNEAYEQLYRKRLYRRFPPQAGGGGGSGAEGHETGAGRQEGPPGPGGASGEGKGQRPRSRRPARPPGVRRPLDWRSLLPSRRAPWGRVAAAVGVAAAIVALGPAARDLLERATARDRPAAPAPRAAEPGPPPGAAPGPRGGPENASGALRAAAGPPERPIRRLTASDTIKAAAGAAAGLPAADLARLFQRAEGLLEVFGLGDPKAKVIAVQGTPDDAGETVFRYGSSLVFFENGRVSGWTDRLPWLHVRPWSQPSLASLDTFSVGSTRAEVISAQGQPSAFTPGSYIYGTSAVHFENDVVTGWQEGDVNLRSFNIPVLPFRDLGWLALR